MGYLIAVGPTHLVCYKSKPVSLALSADLNVLINCPQRQLPSLPLLQKRGWCWQGGRDLMEMPERERTKPLKAL